MLQKLVNDTRGQGLSEYGLLIALIAVVCIGVLTYLGSRIASKFQDVTNALQ